MITPDQAGDLIVRFNIHLHKRRGISWLAMIGHYGHKAARGIGPTWIEAIEEAVIIWMRK